MKKICFALLCLLPVGASAQPHQHGRVVRFPNVAGYLSLSCDFHIHTVFSDGSVWPNIRVDEAVKDSLDAISLTEHIEYQPHKEDIPHPDRNRSYDIASKIAKPFELIVAKGAEITRGMPPGHNNAIFIKDANKLLQEDALTVFREANAQGAFTFWNHPNWTAQRKDGIARITDMHKQLIQEKLLHGIEVVNEMTYSDEALQIALDNDLTIMGTSDIHGLVDWQFGIDKGGHRPFTLVFAKERSEQAIKEALFEKRTLAYFNHTLIGREVWMAPLLNASLRVKKAAYIGTSTLLEITLENLSDMPLILLNESGFTFHQHSGLVTVEPRSETKIQVKTIEEKDKVRLAFRVLNAVTAPGKYALINLDVKVE
ncbi:MAG: Sb-PDE family phosphodiesterase [Saprospiraceae bacterium]|jgi:hypothetical protein